MGSRKLVRDLFFSQKIVFQHLQSQQRQAVNVRLHPTLANVILGSRHFSVFNEFSRKVKGEAKSNQDFQQSVKELKEKAEELKEAKEGLKARTKQTAEQLYKTVDGVWTEAGAAVKKVSADVKEKISAATEEVSVDVKEKISAATGEVKETLFSRFSSSAASKLSLGFQKLKDAKVVDLAKKGYDIVKDELSGNPSKRRRLKYAAASSPKEPISTKTDIVVLPTKQSRWGKKWEAFKEKMQGHPIYKRVSGFSEPVVTKGQELAEDMRERWETSDHPVVHKIQDLNETVFGETATALSFKEIRRRDPSFSLPEFVAEVQEMIRPTLNAYLKGDVEAMKKNCSREVIERCRAEHRAYESQDIFFDNKILHVSEVEVRETKMMGTTPIIIVAFQTQQIYCVRDRHGSITEGGKDTIHTVYYAWAMQQVDDEEMGGDEVSLYPIWRLREMQQLGIKALI